MKAAVIATMFVLAGLVFTGCCSIPDDDADERPWSNTAGGGPQDRDAADDNR